MALPKFSFLTAGGTVTFPWLQWLERVDATVIANRTSGPTSERPDYRTAYVGMVYLDTDLGADSVGMPVWAAKVEKTGVTWVDATGAIV